MTREAARFVSNFMCVSRLRPKDNDNEADGNSDDLVSDEELILESKDLTEALQTKIGGKKLSARKSQLQNSYGLWSINEYPRRCRDMICRPLWGRDKSHLCFPQFILEPVQPTDGKCPTKFLEQPGDCSLAMSFELA